jgi:nitroreductase
MKTSATKATVASVIQERRTIQKFKPDPLSMETLHELLNVAVWAPNHGLREPWRFIVFKDEGKTVLTDAISEFLIHGPAKMDAEAVTKRMDYFKSIPVLLLVVMPLHPKDHERDEDFAAASALIQNLQLAAWESGIGVLWRTNTFLMEEEVKQKLGVERNERIVGLLQIGYPDQVPPARPRTPAENRITVIDSANTPVRPNS